MMTENIFEIPLDKIKIGIRNRKEYGDISSLSDSIKQLGLLQPIGITSNYELIFGHRRLKAFYQLGISTIPSRIIDVPNIILAEHAENEIRKDFTVSERVEIGKAVEAELKAQGERRGRPKQENESQVELVSCKIPVKLPEFPEGETRELAAKKAGFGSDKTYRDAKTVIEKAIPELIDAMDCGNVAISTAAKLATANVEIQKQAVFNPKEAVRLAKEASSNKVKEIRSIAKEENNKSRELKEQIRESRREENRVIIRNTTSIEQINVKFATILIDPPWDWGDEGDCDQFGRARPDYATLSFDQILALPVNEKADIDCHIYLWITNRSLPKGFSLLDAWGFRYVTCLTWVKPYFGMGNYFRGQTEHILFGIKGSQPLKRNDASTVFHAHRGKDGHSSKPVEFYGFIESCSPGPYLEMFARTKREGWVSWGQNS